MNMTIYEKQISLGTEMIRRCDSLAALARVRRHLATDGVISIRLGFAMLLQARKLREAP